MCARVDMMLVGIARQFKRLQPTLESKDEDYLIELNKYFRVSVSLLTMV